MSHDRPVDDELAADGAVLIGRGAWLRTRRAMGGVDEESNSDADDAEREPMALTLCARRRAGAGGDAASAS